MGVRRVLSFGHKIILALLIQLLDSLVCFFRPAIVNITSTAGFLVVPSMTGYACSKFAAEAFSDGLRRELSPFGITVVVIEPVVMKTPIVQFTPMLEKAYQSKLIFP